MAEEFFGVKVVIADAEAGGSLNAKIQSEVEKASKGVKVPISDIEGGEKVGAQIGKDITTGMSKAFDANKAFASIIKSINKVSDAFVPLNKALTTEGTAFNKMATSGASSLDGLISKLTEIQSLVQSIEQKSLGLNITTQARSGGGAGQIIAYKQAVQELVPQLQQAAIVVGQILNGGTRGLQMDAVSGAVNGLTQMERAIGSLNGATSKSAVTNAAARLQMIYTSFHRLAADAGSGRGINFPEIQFPEFGNFSADPVEKLLRNLSTTSEQAGNATGETNQQIEKIITSLTELSASLTRIESQLSTLSSTIDLSGIATNIDKIATSFIEETERMTSGAAKAKEKIKKDLDGLDMADVENAEGVLESFAKQLEGKGLGKSQIEKILDSIRESASATMKELSSIEGVFNGGDELVSAKIAGTDTTGKSVSQRYGYDAENDRLLLESTRVVENLAAQRKQAEQVARETEASWTEYERVQSKEEDARVKSETKASWAEYEKKKADEAREAEQWAQEVDRSIKEAEQVARETEASWTEVEEAQGKEIASQKKATWAEYERQQAKVAKDQEAMLGVENDRIKAAVKEGTRIQQKQLSSFESSQAKYHSAGEFDTAGVKEYDAAVSGLKAKLDALRLAYEQGSGVDSAKADFDSAAAAVKNLGEALNSEMASVKNADSALELLNQTENKLTQNTGGSFDTSRIESYRAAITQAKDSVERMNAAGDKAGMSKAYEQLNVATKAAGEYARSLNTGTVSIQKMDSAILQMQQYLRNNTNLSAENVAAIKRIINALREMEQAENMDPSVFNAHIGAFTKIRIAAQEAGQTGRTSIQEIGSRLKNLLTTRLGGQLFMYMQQGCRDLVQAVVDVDSAMAQLQIVTNATDGQMQKFFEASAESAKNLGASVSDVLGSVETFSRLGYNLDDALGLSQAATIMSNVAATSVDEATTGITSIVKGFGYDASEAMGVADILTDVGQKYAVSAAELMEALERGGSSLQAANNTLEEAVALVAAGNASVQNAASVGTILKTMSARIRGAKAELEELGEYEEGVTLSSSKLREEILQLTGVDIMFDDNTFKSTYQIVKEIAGVWEELSDIDRASVIEDMAGKRGGNVFVSMIQNINDLTGAYDTAMNAGGSASKANEIYLDSIAGRIGKLKAAFQTLSNDAIDSDLVKTVVSGGTGILELLDGILERMHAIPALITTIAGALSAIKNVGELIKQFRSLITLWDDYAHEAFN